ncbi:MAG: GNAT family N-acetyltransferase [Lachnospiraceae bacterium]|nr:GNAT family N-acetyltransferase [Lachnospiraceae bacterium]
MLLFEVEFYNGSGYNIIVSSVSFAERRMIVMKILTERLMIRDLCEADHPEFERTLNDVQKSCFGSGMGFLNWLISQYSAMDITNGLLSFGIFERRTEKFIGTIGVGDHYDLHEPELFYHLLPEHRGHGFATEAAKEVTRWALENYEIEYLIGTAAIDNVRSQHVLERCSYQFVEVRSLSVHVTNERYDFKYYRYYRMKERIAEKYVIVGGAGHTTETSGRGCGRNIPP